MLVGPGQAQIFSHHLCYFLKDWNVASEEVVLELVKCKCLPILLYGLECCPLNKSDVQSLDFAVSTRFLMKLFKSVHNHNHKVNQLTQRVTSGLQLL